MEPIRTGHERPVDLVSAKLLWKAPWWAHYNEPAKKAVLEVVKSYPSEVWIDYTKSPPPRPDPILNRIGTLLEWKDGSTGVIIGYADNLTHYKQSRQFVPQPNWWIGPGWQSRKTHAKTVSIHAWWVQHNGEIERIVWSRVNSRGWKVKA